MTLFGIPLIYLPREDFAEFAVLEKGIIECSHGYRLSSDEFSALRWERVLKESIIRERPAPRVSDGARICAREMERIIGGDSRIA